MSKTTQEWLDEIDTKIQALIDSPEVDYKIGDKSVSASQKLEQLQELRKQIIAQGDGEVDITAFDYDVSQFGEDNSQYEE